MAPPSGEIVEVAVGTVAGALGAPILWRARDWFDGSSHIRTPGARIYGLGVCGVFVVLGVIAFTILAVG
jgi:hypothetical protein